MPVLFSTASLISLSAVPCSAHWRVATLELTAAIELLTTKLFSKRSGAGWHYNERCGQVGAPTIGTGEYAVLPDELSISFWSVSGT
jgi:hypothetical protein